MFKIFKSEKTDYDYFEFFEEIAMLIVEVAESLYANLFDYQLPLLGEKVVEMHKIERTADSVKNQMMRYLYQDFLPPIEREDIINMVYALDTVLNNMEDILIHLDMYQVEAITSDMLHLLELIKKASDYALEMMHELSNFKNPKKLALIIEEITIIEEQADKIYYEAVKRIHVDKGDVLESYKYSTIYDVFETCFDSFEDLANVVEAIILKNT